MYVVKVMQEQTLDETRPGTHCEIQIRKQGKYNYKFAKLLDEKFAAFDNGDKVIVLTPSEHEDLLQQYKDADNFVDQHMIEDLQNKINSKDSKIKKMKVTIADNNAIITSLTDENRKLTFGIKEQSKTIEHNEKCIEDLEETIKQHEQTIAELKEHNDAIAKQLEDSIDASEHQKLKESIDELKDELATSQKQCKYWHDSYANIIESSDALANENENYKLQNEKLRNDNNAISETNKLLNDNIMALKTTFDETKQQMQSDFKKQEKELKENIKKQQTHIDELTQKKDSLLPMQEYIPQTQHYNEINALKDKLRKAQQEIETNDAEIEKKLATQKSDLEIEHTNEKAQMLVAYNQELDSLKLQYNNLAKEYNYLLNSVDSLTRINTLLNGKHNEIKKNKEQVPLLEIATEQLPPSDENVLEYVPKD